MVTIKEVDADGVAGLLPLLGEVQDLHVQTHPDIFRNDTSSEERADFLHDFISRDTVTALAYCLSDASVAGYLIYEIQNQDQSALRAARQLGVLHHIAVTKSRRGQGIASQLGNEMKARLRAKGIAKFCAQHFAFNEPS